MKYAMKSIPGLVDSGDPKRMEMVPELRPDGQAFRKSFLVTNFTMLNNFCVIKHALKPVPVLADVGVPHGDGNGPRTPPRCMGQVWKKISND